MLNAAPTDLTGKTCLVTGAVGGIGASAVEHFAALGATVYATDVALEYTGPATYKSFDLLSDAGLTACCDWIAEIKPDVLFNNAAVFGMGSFEGKQPGQKKREVGDAVPLGYMGAPADVARAAVFLASDQSAYMTAQTIGVDGGNVLR